MRRAAGQGLESERAGAAKGIEDKGIGDAGGSIAGKDTMDQPVEQGLARPSEDGRTASPGGAASRRPLRLPPTMRILCRFAVFAAGRTGRRARFSARIPSRFPSRFPARFEAQHAGGPAAFLRRRLCRRSVFTVPAAIVLPRARFGGRPGRFCRFARRRFRRFGGDFGCGFRAGPAASPVSERPDQCAICSRNTRAGTFSTTLVSSLPNWNGPYAVRISRFTVSPRCSQTFRISRFLPSRMVMVSQALAPCWRSSRAWTGP